MSNATEIDEIKNEIANLIDNNITTVQQVSKYWRTIFSGYPAVNIVFIGVENDFESNVENMRTYHFKLQILEQVSQNPDLVNVDDKAMERAEKIIDAVVSDMIDLFDQNYVNDTITYGLPTNTEPKMVVKISGGYCLMQEVNIKYRKSFNVT